MMSAYSANTSGLRPVDVPLPGVEGGPHPAVQLGGVAEAAGREVGEDLRQGRLVPVRLGAVGEDVEVVPVVRIAVPRRLRPGVLGRDVVEHQVHHQADARCARSARGQRAQVVDRAEIGCGPER